MKTFKIIALAAVALLLPSMGKSQALPTDSAVRVGKLPNGLTYYIRHNELPKNRASFYIAQKVGSVQEDDSQRGLAHFLEHMCFNGTKHFPGDALIKYLETKGVKFGENLNAYTSTDETVYNIDEVPVSNTEVIDSCLYILHDWSNGLTLDPKEIDKERGVIREEWRMRSSAFQRIYERNLPTLYPGSKYAHRMPIGLVDEVIMKFKPQVLRDYYAKWYRPDLQGIVIVGDVDVDKTEAAIKNIFSSIEMPKNAAKYETYPVPDNTTPIYVVDKDKELQSNSISVMFKRKPVPLEARNSMYYMATQVMNDLASSMFNARLREMSKKPDCPFVSAGAGDGTYLISKTADAYGVRIVPKSGQDAAAFRSVMEEVRRVQEFGFTDTEFFRARENFMSGMESAYNNRDKRYNSDFIDDYVQNFLANEPIPSLADEYKFYKAIMPRVKASDISTLFRQELTARTDTNFVVLAVYPEKEGVTGPTVDQLKEALSQAQAAQLTAYVDNVKTGPLVKELPAKGKVVKETKAPYGYTCWTLSNGARVYYRVTDFNNSEVQFSGRSWGGSSKLTLADRVNSTLLGGVMNSGGWGGFTATELQKALAGKQVGVGIGLSELSETISGGCVPKDLRTLFELTYLHFQKPTEDKDAYNNFMETQRTKLANLETSPEQAWSDSVSSTLYDRNPLRQRLTIGDLRFADYNRIRQIYSERFNTTGDFDFFVTGAFNVDSLRTMVETYIASLPAVKKRETYSDPRILTHKGDIENRFLRVMETPKADIAQIWTGNLPYSLKNDLTVDILSQVLTQRYLKSIREESGIAYSVDAYGSTNQALRQTYQIVVVCPIKPEKCDSALILMQKAIDDIAASGVKAEEIDKAKEYMQKTYADSQKSNSYWMSNIVSNVLWGNDFVTPYLQTLQSVTSSDIQKFVTKTLLRQHNRANVIMLPLVDQSCR